MDVSFNNVLEVSRQYFMGVPKQAQMEGSGQPVWPAGAPLPEEGTPAQSGAPAPSSRPPSAAAAPPAPATTPVAAPPPRPPSEPIEPEPHIIHKATVMREAAEKRRELPDVDDEEEPAGTLSPPSHIIRKPPRTLPSPAPAPAAPCPSPARPPSAASLPPPPAPEPQPEQSVQYRPPLHQLQTPSSRPPDPFAPSRLPDPYSPSRPPEQYARYHYESTLPDSGRNSHGLLASPQPSVSARHSPQTYARISSSISQHTASRLREGALHSPPAPRYAMPPAQPPPPHNDRVPPIYHPQVTPPTQRISSAEVRSSQIYPPPQPRRETSPYARVTSHYDRQPAVPSRKYDPQQAYPGYRPSSTAPQMLSNHRVDTQQQLQYKHSAIDTMNAHYSGRVADRSAPPLASSPHDPVRLPPRVDYPSMSRSADARSGYHYQTPSTSSSRYGANVPVPPIPNSSLQPRTSYLPATAAKTSYDYLAPHSVQTSQARSSAKSGYPNQQARMTVSVTSIVNQMNQSKQKRTSPVPATSQLNQNKQKRESPLDLSVKTVKNSADSSTTQDDAVDSATAENKTLPLQPRQSLISSRNTHIPTVGHAAPHKVDFAPNFGQYGDRSASHSYSSAAAPGHPPVRYNGSFDTRRVPEQYPVESPHHIYPERSKYSVPVARADFVPKIDLTRSVPDQRHNDSRIRDDRNFVIDNRKRPTGPIVSNIPEKIIRYETGISENRIERMNQSAREQHDLMSRPVYSYSSHKQFEAFQNEHKRANSSSIYREHHLHPAHRYPSNPYSGELQPREPSISDYHANYHDRNPSVNSRHHHIIQKTPSHRDVHPHHLDVHSRVPANKSVLSILRTSLETKQTSYSDPVRTVKPDIIVIDDVDDPVIEINDLTKENDQESCAKSVIKPFQSHATPGLGHHIQMPKAVDSIPRDSDYQQCESSDLKSKSPENDVASRIRTKAELKVMPPSQENSMKTEPKQVTSSETDKERKILPKSQKQHLFNQIREDLRLESVIKCEKPSETLLPEVKIEPMNIEEIERDAEISIKTEIITDNYEPESAEVPEDLDWASACDNFMEQLKSGCHKKKAHRKRVDTMDTENDSKLDKLQQNEIELPKLENPLQQVPEKQLPIPADVVIKQEPIDEDEIKTEDVLNTSLTPDRILCEDLLTAPVVLDTEKTIEEPIAAMLPENQEMKPEKKTEQENNVEKNESDKKQEIEKKNDSVKNKETVKSSKVKTKIKIKSEKSSTPIKREPKEKKVEKSNKTESEKVTQIKTVIKEEQESTDDDEPLIKSKIMKEKEKSERNLKYQLLKDLSEKSAYVKLEFCDVDVNKNSRRSLDAAANEKEEKQSKGKMSRQLSRSKIKSLSIDNAKNDKKEDDYSTDSDDDLCVASRLRLRKNTKTEDNSKTGSVVKTLVKSSPSKKLDNSSASNSSTPARKAAFGDGSDFHPGWEEELYRYKRSLRMPTRLIAIPRGRSGGPFVRGSGAFFTRGTTSLPDLDPAPLSPAPSSAPSAATDDLYARRPDKLTLDSDLDSNSSYSAPTRLHYDSEASTSTIFSSKTKKKASSIVDVLIQKCGKKEDSKKKSKDRDDKTPKVISKSFYATELLPTPSLGLVNNNNRSSLSAKKEKLLENISYLGAFRKETVATFRHTFINNTDGLIGATEEFAPVVLKTRTRTESRVLKQRATIREVFGDDRPASAPPSSCRDEETPEEKEEIIVIKKEPDTESKPKLKPKKIAKDKLKRSSSIRDGLRSTKSLKRNDAKGRLMRLKKRNSIMKSLNSKRMKEMSTNKHKSESNATGEDKTKPKDENSPLSADGNGEVKKRFKRLFTRRKFSSGFDYIRKKKKIIRREEGCPKVRRPAVKPSPESVHDIHKEIKGWFINKSVGETHLHRAARLGYTDCVAYCLEKMTVDPSAKDNAGFTPLHVAAQKGHVRIARLLLQYGANVSAAAQGGIRPLHEACENSHVEVIRLLLSYGADPLLGTYAGQTPEDLTEGPATMFLQLHIADVQGHAVEPWRFPPPTEIIDRDELGYDPLSSPPPASPPPPPDSMIEIQCTEAPLPPFYSLRTSPGQPADGLWCLLQDITNLLQIKSKDSLLKQIHCGSGSPKELLREIRTQEFLERAQCHQLLCAGEKVNVRASKVALVRVTDKLRQLLKIETALVS